MLIPKKYNSNSFPMIHGNMYKTLSIVEKSYGFLIKRQSDYVSQQTIKLHVQENKYSFAIVKTTTNYRQPYQFRLYFDDLGNEIIEKHGETDKKVWLLMQKD